jgi:hypothetical protein
VVVAKRVATGFGHGIFIVARTAQMVEGRIAFGEMDTAARRRGSRFSIF